MPGWIKDVNMWIVGAGNRHWERDGDANGDQPRNRLNSAVHSMYRINLSHNLLIHLFRSRVVENGVIVERKLTFDKYYNDKIHQVLDFFAESVRLMPTDNDDHDEKNYLTRDRLDAFRDDLLEASDIAREDAPLQAMRRLYERDDINGTKKALTRVRAVLLRSRRNIRWICIPFLKYSDPKLPNPPGRPIGDHIDLHINGTVNSTDIPRDQWQIGVKNLDYLDFLFYEPQSQDEANWLHNARTFAIEKEIFDSEDVVTRVRRESGEADDIKGGGNGYICSTSSGTRKCIVAPAYEYCVHNNTNFCP